MKKSELKKHLVEALTPDEAAKVEPKYKETYAAMIKGKGPLKLKKYDNPDKVVRGRVVNTIKNESLKIAEKLGKTADVGDYKDDFRKSDAPQFKGKSKKKRDQMATAAFLNKEEQKLDEIDAMMEDAQEKSKENYSNYFKKMDKNRLEELVKSALMGPISEKKQRPDYPDVDGDGDTKEPMVKALKDKEKSKDKKVDETAEIKDYPGQIKNNIKANVKSVKTFGDEILRHIDAVKAEEPQGDQYVDNPKLKMAIKNLQSVAGDKEGKVDEAEINITKMMDFAKLAKKVKDATEFIEKITSQLGNQSPEGKKALTSMYNSLKTMEESENTIDESFDSLSKNIKEDNVDEDVVKGSNIKKVGDKYRVLSGKTGKMWKQKYDSKKDAEAALRGYFASQNESLSERILKELRGGINEMAGEDLELKSLAKKMIPTLKKLGFEVEYSTDTSMKTLKNAGDKFVALRVQDGMLGAHIPFKAGLDAAKEIQKEIQKSLGNKFEYKLTKSKRGPGLEFYTILIRNK